MRTFAFRIHPGKDLKKEILDFTRKNNIKAGCILTCVGSLTRATLRMADETIVKELDQRFEIVSLVGTLCQDGVHLHISLSDADGNVIGGHVKEGCLIYVTAEVVIADLGGFGFSREFDENTGFRELVVEEVPGVQE